MAKEPWEEKIVNENTETRSRKSRGPLLSTPWLTALLSVFFVIIVAILFIFFYTSNSGGNRETETSGFYGASVSKSKEKVKSENKSKSSKTKESSTEASESTSPESSSSTETSSSTEAGKGQTIIVQPGEGAASIATRAGISVDQLQALNPSHMTLGYWYANPGDAVYIN
ncbi:LysM domain-containing protein [Streptococcus uberis]|uniref:SAG1386/EF1546 family surface-associated protein n=1 Tax=Streptococcus uberis TaxID=1349 RepID=UPI00062045C5|nr:SAG1386/EF1546 family surface-associated protein [Streptococcus uberis]KKF56222.1 membrane protein [Streptococcus uberis 6780]MCK1166856.1 LysM peptidoglycan-binding domain-containing protein [Streptococcus uberis]MCK1193888.1 LysM peptidoglycan-binding domain-containing protein [Streptococcus uberis]MCK1197662.1 LysM peptidoglycan-binding domain-containing protein [Streptococcus uberis]MCK1217946.1 LysM peptidoglycan-binding domain-containing protein [Streptococcus uberis]